MKPHLANKSSQPEPHTGGWQIQWKFNGNMVVLTVKGQRPLDANIYNWTPVEHESWDSEEDAMERLKIWQGYSFGALMDFRVVKI
jgi:hypothetical protein